MALSAGETNIGVWSTPASRHRFPTRVVPKRVLESYRKATCEHPKPLVLSAFLAGCQLRLTRKAGGSTARSAVAEVRTEPVRPDFWDGSGMVLFVKGTEKTVPSLGRIGSFLDKQCFDGALAKLVADTSFDASLGSVRVHQADKGIQNVILVGVGAGDDWQQVGLATGPELQKFEGKVALVCIDGLQVEPLVVGLLQGLSGKGPKTVELLGAFPAGSGAAIERAQLKHAEAL